MSVVDGRMLAELRKLRLSWQLPWLGQVVSPGSRISVSVSRLPCRCTAALAAPEIGPHHTVLDGM